MDGMRFPCFVLYLDRHLDWRWCLLDAAGEPAACSASGFSDVHACMADAARVPLDQRMPIYNATGSRAHDCVSVAREVLRQL